MKKIKTLVFVLFLASSTAVFAREVSEQGTSLTSPAAMALKGLLEQHPDGAAHIVTSLDNSRTILDGLEKYEQLMTAKSIPAEKQEALYKKVVAKFKGIILDPIKEFFMLVYDYKSLLKPVIEESLGTSFKGSIFYKFLGAPSDQVATFFDYTVNTKDELIAACQEFAILFGDLEATMPEAFESGRQWLEALRKEQEQAAKEEETEEKTS